MRTEHALYRAGLVALLMGTSSAYPGECETAKISNPQPGAGFGITVSLDNDRMAVGSYHDERAHVYLKTPGGWVHEAVIVPGDPNPGNFFGAYVDLDGDRLLVSAFYDSQPILRAGAAYVFRLENGAWVQEAKLIAPDAAEEDWFAHSIALSGDVAVIGTPRDKAYVFRRQGNNWNYETKLVRTSNSFGSQVATDGQIVVVTDGKTTVYVFRWNGSAWIEEAALSRPGLNLAGRPSVAVAAATIAVGAPENMGEVSVFKKVGAVWTEQAVLQPWDNIYGDAFFGDSVAMRGDAIIVGARFAGPLVPGCTQEVGTAYVFHFDGVDWMPQQRLAASDETASSYRNFGIGVALGDGFAVVGAHGDPAGGALYFFEDGPLTDCDESRIADSCEIAVNAKQDCNSDAIPDVCNIAAGTSQDCNLDARPDECDPDCNGNGTSDLCDLYSQTSQDCNENRVPDECDMEFDCIKVTGCHTASVSVQGLYTGAKVAIDGDWAIASSTHDEWDENGSAWLFARSGSSWNFHSDITPPPIPGFSNQGAGAVAISGDTAAVVQDGIYGGSVYVYRRSAELWAVEAILPPADALALEGDVLVGNSSVYRRTGTTWSFEATLAPDDPQPDDGFGTRIAIAGGRILVGAPLHSDGGVMGVGAAYVFRNESGSWVQEARLTGPGHGEAGFFGDSVAINEDFAAVGSPGVGCLSGKNGVRVFRRSGQSWDLVTDLHPFGSVSMDERSLIIGDQYDDIVNQYGAAYVYRLDPVGAYWILQQKLVSPMPSSRRFGISTAVSGPWAFIGAPYGEPRAHFFAVGGDCNQNTIADLCDIHTGSSIDSNGDDRPDDCPCDHARPAFSTGARPEPYPGCDGDGYAAKNRYLTLIPPQTPVGAAGIALRVTLGPMPGPLNCPGVGDFSAFDGAVMWVGPEHMAGAMNTGVHRLQADPYFHNWNDLDDGVLKISDCNIVPCATYTIEAISDLDYPSGPYAPGLVLATTPVWGDVVTNGIADFSDISQVLDRFRDLPSALPRTWCDVGPNNPSQGGLVNIDFSDVSYVVDAFRGADYPFSGPTAPNACP